MRRLLGWGVGAAAVALSAFGEAGQSSEPAVGKPYRVVEGAVDSGTYNGYRRYHATCSHCPGPDGMGSSFGPPLIDRPLPFAAFVKIVRLGSARGGAVMQGSRTIPTSSRISRTSMPISAPGRTERSAGATPPAGVNARQPSRLARRRRTLH